MMLKIISPHIVRKRFGQSGDIALDSGVVPYQKVVLAAVRKNGFALQHAVPMYVNDEIVLEAVRNNGLALEWASPQHRMDKGIVFEAVRQNAAALQWASAQCRADRHVANQEVWLKCVKAFMRMRRELPEYLMHDAEFRRLAGLRTRSSPTFNMALGPLSIWPQAHFQYGLRPTFNMAYGTASFLKQCVYP